MKQPEHIGKYEVLEEIGRGGMGIVYKALHPVLERYVAIKVLPEYLARQDPDFRTRFLREARIMVDLSQSGIVRVIDADSWQSSMYLVMEFVDGWTIRQVMSGADAKGRKPPFELTVDRSVDILQQVAGALGYAHEKGIIHRDVKPSNILIDKNGHTWITDFGIAKSLSSATMATQAGVSLGTPEYMAPEQFSEGTRSQIDSRADIYSLGCVFYEMVTGKTPFEGETPLGVAYKHVNLPCPHPRQFNPAVSPALEQVILKMLAKNRDERYESCESLREDLLLLKRGDLDHMLAHEVAVETPVPVELILGAVELASTPAGARVYVDGKYVGKAPTTKDGLSLGFHNAVFILRGCEEVSSTFELTTDSPNVVVHASLKAEAQPESEPEGEQDMVTRPEPDEPTLTLTTDRKAEPSEQATSSVEPGPDITSPLPPPAEGESATVIVRPSGNSGLVEVESATAMEPAIVVPENEEAPTMAIHAPASQHEPPEQDARTQLVPRNMQEAHRSPKAFIAVALVAAALIAVTAIGRWIEASSTKQPAPLVGKVTLSNPSNGSTVAPGNAAFAWQATNNATKYEFVLYDGEGKTALDTTVDATTLTITLDSSETITWKVRGGDSSGNWGDWSPSWALTLQPPTGTSGIAAVESDQSGTVVAVDGVEVVGALLAAQPLSIPLSSDVTHTLAFSKPGFRTLQRQVTVKPGQTSKVSVVMEKTPPAVTSSTGSLYVSSSPSGARIYLNGKDSGHTTPWSFEKLAVGTYAVRCSTTSTYRDASQSAAVNSGESTSVYLTLTKLTPVAATIALSSSPSQAIVYVDGNLWKSMTPCSITGLVSGRTYTLRIEKTGYVSAERKVTAKSGSTAVSVPLQSTATGHAQLAITSSPSGALVFVNGILAGTTPYSGPSPVIGPVSIRVEKSGYVAESRVTVLQNGQLYTLSVPLTLEP
ncbi:MAG: serine/threonine protein kinase [Caldiserica bacterium]|nr:serine/threonine protein kinase [Caldisericota bacterium]